MARRRVILCLEHVRSSYNVGSLFRTAAAAGVERIVLSPFCPTPERSEVKKTSLGGEMAVAWEVGEIPAFLMNMKAEGYATVAIEQTERSTNLFEARVEGPVVLVLGHEREGVSAETLALCDHHLEIPMAAGPVKSLNVANAGAVAMYALAAQTPGLAVT